MTTYRDKAAAPNEVRFQPQFSFRYSVPWSHTSSALVWIKGRPKPPGLAPCPRGAPCCGNTPSRSVWWLRTMKTDRRLCLGVCHCQAEVCHPNFSGLWSNLPVVVFLVQSISFFLELNEFSRISVPRPPPRIMPTSLLHSMTPTFCSSPPSMTTLSTPVMSRCFPPQINTQFYGRKQAQSRACQPVTG